MGAVQSPECERARLWVSLSLDGELSEIEQVSLRAHVGRCAACAEFGHDVGALTQELRDAALASLRRSAFREVPPRRRSAAVRVLQLSAAAAAVVLAAGVGGVVGSLSSRDAATVTAARTVGLDLGALHDRAVVAGVSRRMPAARITPTVAL